MDENTVLKLREVEIEILSEIHRICNEHNINYSLGYGSLLGAVRHQGFIPWDDDIDIVMPREDYNNFIKLCNQGNLNENYFLQDIDTDAEYHLSFAKIRKNNTLFDESGVKQLNIHKGIFVDIFPIDYSRKDNGIVLKCRDRIIKNLNHIAYMRRLEVDSVSTINRILYILTRPLSVRTIMKLSKAIATAKKSGKYAVDFSGWLDYTKKTVPSEYYKDRMLVKFENKQFYAPKEYDRILKKCYGNYMELPPEEERENHNAAKIVFEVKKGENVSE